MKYNINYMKRYCNIELLTHLYNIQYKENKEEYNKSLFYLEEKYNINSINELVTTFKNKNIVTNKQNFNSFVLGFITSNKDFSSNQSFIFIKNIEIYAQKYNSYIANIALFYFCEKYKINNKIIQGLYNKTINNIEKYDYIDVLLVIPLLYEISLLKDDNTFNIITLLEKYNFYNLIKEEKNIKKLSELLKLYINIFSNKIYKKNNFNNLNLYYLIKIFRNIYINNLNIKDIDFLNSIGISKYTLVFLNYLLAKDNVSDQKKHNIFIKYISLRLTSDIVLNNEEKSLIFNNDINYIYKNIHIVKNEKNLSFLIKLNTLYIEKIENHIESLKNPILLKFIKKDDKLYYCISHAINEYLDKDSFNFLIKLILKENIKINPSFSFITKMYEFNYFSFDENLKEKFIFFNKTYENFILELYSKNHNIKELLIYSKNFNIDNCKVVADIKLSSIENNINILEKENLNWYLECIYCFYPYNYISTITYFILNDIILKKMNLSIKELKTLINSLINTNLISNDIKFKLLLLSNCEKIDFLNINCFEYIKNNISDILNSNILIKFINEINNLDEFMYIYFLIKKQDKHHILLSSIEEKIYKIMWKDGYIV